MKPTTESAAAVGVPARMDMWLDLLGDRWALWIMLAIGSSGARFSELADAPGLSRRVLADRLRRLEHAGMVERRLYHRRPVRYEYHHTRRGAAVRDAGIEMLGRAAGAELPPVEATHGAALPGDPVHPADRMLAADLAYASEVYRATIEPLVRYDESYSARLTETLRVYLDCEASVSVAAVRLHAHRHTVRYRLGRVRELSGLDVDALGDRERLILGLRAGAVLSAAGLLEFPPRG